MAGLVQTSYPGVYIQEIPPSNHIIAGVPTSVAAFVGGFSQGAVNKPQQVFGMADVEKEFGPITDNTTSEAYYGLQQFFMNGGSEAWVVNVAKGESSGVQLSLIDAATQQPIKGNPFSIVIRAASQGNWAKNVRFAASTNADGSVNILAQLFKAGSGGSYQLSTSENYSSIALGDLASTLNRQSKILSIDTDLSVLPGAAQMDQYTIAPTGTYLDASALSLAKAVGNVSVTATDFANTNQISTGAISQDAVTSILRSVLVDSGFLSSKFSKLKGYDNVSFIVDKSGAITAQYGDPAKLQPLPIKGTGDTPFITADTRGGLSGALIDLSIASFAQDQTINVGSATVKFLASDLTVIKDQVMKQFCRIILGQLIKARGLNNAHVTANGTTFAISANNASIAALQLDFSGDDSFNPALSSNVQSYTLTKSAFLSNLNAATKAPAAANKNDKSGNAPAAAASTGPISDQYKTLQTIVDGEAPQAPDLMDLMGDPLEQTGIYALNNVDIVNILCIPDTLNASQIDVVGFADAVQSYCAQKRIFYIVDAPKSVNSPAAMESWIPSIIEETNLATYFPHFHIADEAKNFEPRLSANSGTLAGLYARTDVNRGVWKAPAGVEANLNGVLSLDYKVNDNEDGVLTGEAVNALRFMTGYGNVSWGARTLKGTKEQYMDDAYSYVPVRRLAYFLEESLFRGTKWAVFEPNGEHLWSELRLSVTTFMQELFQKGAFAGTSPKEAFLVKCDETTTTAVDQAEGRVNITVGFAPLRPAEFVIIQFQQSVQQS